MKKQIFTLLITLFSMVALAQETPPPMDANFKQLATSQFYLQLPDSAVWQYKGAVYGWARLGRYKDIKNLQELVTGKVDKVSGKGLSTEDYTTSEKTKLSGIATGATANATDAQLRDRTTHTGTQAISTVTGLQTALDAKISASEKGANNGIATLDAGGKIPFANLPSSLMIYKGVWNLSTNTPVLVDGSGITGWVYKVTGALIPTNFNFGSGDIKLVNGDFVIYNGTAWERSAGTDNVVSVNGQQGVVTLTKSDVGLGNVDNTSDQNKPLSISTINALADKENRIPAGSTDQYLKGDKTWQTLNTSVIAEGSKLFYTEARVSANPTVAGKQNQLNGTGFVKASGTSISYDNTSYEPSFSKNTAFNKNFGTVAGTVAEGNDSRIVNGQTAFGWGNHASAGYAFSNGSNASGTWNINIGGNAGTATYWGSRAAELTVYATGNVEWLVGKTSQDEKIRAIDKPHIQSWLGIPSGGETLQSVTDRYAGTDKEISVNGLNSNRDIALNGSGRGISFNGTGTQLYESGGSLRLYTNTLDRLSVFSNGNVSIGTTDLGYKLAVNGTGYFAGNISSSGSLSASDITLSKPQGLLASFQKTDYVDGRAWINWRDATGTEISWIGYGGSDNTFSFSNSLGSFQMNNSLYVSGAITASGGFFNSDIRLKNLTKYAINHTSISDLKPITYTWKDGRDSLKHIGYSAQEVEKILPDAVSTDSKGMKSVNYVEVLVAKIHELEKRIDELEKERRK